VQHLRFHLDLDVWQYCEWNVWAVRNRLKLFDVHLPPTQKQAEEGQTMHPSMRQYTFCFLKVHLLGHQLCCPWPAQGGNISLPLGAPTVLALPFSWK